jgi:hypothetical protein
MKEGQAAGDYGHEPLIWIDPDGGKATKTLVGKQQYKHR